MKEKSEPSASKPPAEVCPRCSESADLALIKGCLRCLKCGFKWDCNGW
jgi:ribosomal protein S27AE